jgi:parallel beta-helix repeat protein
MAGILVQGDAKLEMHKDRLVGNSGPNMSVEDKGTIVARACVFEGGSSHGLVISSSQCCRLIVCHLQLNEAGNVLVEKNGRVEMIRCQLSGSTRTHAGPSVWCREGAGVTLTECTLRHSREALVKVGDQSKATMQGTLLERGESDGILVENEACAQLTHVIVRECDTALHLKGDARIEGDENEILDNRVTGVLSEDNSYLALEQTTLSGSRVSNISLTHNACIELRGALVHDSKTGIELDGLSHGTIQGSHIHSCSVGIHIRTEAGAQTNVLESSIGYCKRLGVLCGRTCAPTLSSCDIRHCGESCIRMAEHTKARFVQCVVHASTAQGVWVGDQAGGCIEGCVITNNNTAGIRLNDQACPDIVDNKIYNNPAGIVVADSARPQISANVFTDNKLSAVQMLDSSGPIVENNKILQGHDIGVMICDLSKGILRQNQLCGAKSTAFELQDDCDPLLEVR